ncbi:3641_t:CDS:1, partial [Racocetra fulgida]
LWMLTRHLQNRKLPCQPQIIPITNPIPIPQIEPDSSNPLDQVSDPSIQSNTDEYLSREEFKYLKTLGLIENDAILDTGIHFIQIRVRDPKRPYDNFNLL